MRKKKFLKKYKNLFIGITLFIWMVFWTTTLLTDLLDESYTIDPGSPESDYLSVDNIFTVFGKWGSLFFFTVQLNWIIPIFFLAKALKLKWANMNIEFALSVWCLIMLVVFWTIIAPFQTWIHRPFAFISDVIVHGVTPLVVIINFISNKKKTTMNLKGLLRLSLTFPAVYYFFAFIIFYATKGSGVIYVFTNFSNPFVLGTTNVFLIFLLNFSTLIFSILIIAGFVLFLNYAKTKKWK